jgi:hypothetical protein
MTLSLVLACVWALLATAIAVLPRRTHWPGAVGLIATGIPLVGYVTWENGPFLGLLVLAAGVSVLRWPLLFLGRWVLRLLRGAD